MAQKGNNQKGSNAKGSQDLIEQGTKDADELNRRLHFLELEYGDGTPFELVKSISKTQIYLASSAESLLMAGREIIRLKEHLPHGEFQEVLSERIGINPNTARRIMRAAVKFSKGSKRSLAIVLEKSKLLELMTEGDEDLEELADGGTLAGLSMDDIARMTRSELRAALRKEKQKNKQQEEVHEKQLHRKNTKIDQLDKHIHHLETKTDDWHPQAFNICMEITEVSAEILNNLERMDTLRDSILNEDFGDGDVDAAIKAMACVYWDSVDQIFIKTNLVSQDCNEVFSGYKHEARPLLDMHEIFGEGNIVAAEIEISKKNDKQ
ncbi:MAG: hypothetical protein FVQ79_00575 [Planctomycetes bacterium]|nr:hypothetical protein [Planctomycetota bacterium]